MLVEELEIEDHINVYVVGDIHGCYTLLMNELNRIGFDFEKDILIGVGDLVDRGEESLKCVSLIGQKWFKTVMGNHEEFCIQGYYDETGERHRFYHKMKNNGGAWFYELPTEKQFEITEIFKELPILIELKYKGKKYGFVHADLPYEDWELVKASVEANDVLEDGRAVSDYCMWAREIVYSRKTVNIALVDEVYFGHTPLQYVYRNGNCTFIDTGAVFGNNLTIIKIGE